MPRQHIIVFAFGGIEIYIAAGLIGIAFFQQRGDDPDKIVDAGGRRDDLFRDFNVQRFQILKKGVAIKRGNLHNGFMLPLCALQHFVLARVAVA